MPGLAENVPLRERFLELCRTADIVGAAAFQNEIARLIPGEPIADDIVTVCGLDVSFNKYSPKIYAAAAIYSLPSLNLVEESAIDSATEFPYVPGFLAYREGPAIIELISRVKTPADILLFDGQGIAHPRGAGIASMIGLLLGRRSIGCAKTKLVGIYDEPGPGRGEQSDLLYRRRLIGRVVRTRANVKPVFVSAGFGVELERSVELVLSLCQGLRLPVPIRRAHLLANVLRQKSLPHGTAGPDA